MKQPKVDPTIVYVRWRDACAHEAADSPAAEPALAELCEVGFLLAETDEVLLIGMELQPGDTHPGRWRLHIPKNAIVERADVTKSRAFKKPRARKPKVDKDASRQTEPEQAA